MFKGVRVFALFAVLTAGVASAATFAVRTHSPHRARRRCPRRAKLTAKSLLKILPLMLA